MSITSLAPALVTFGFLMVSLPLLDRNRTSGRIIPCGICVYLAIRMLTWRLTQTLPPFSLTIEGLWAYLFMTFEITGALSGILFFIFMMRTKDRREESANNQNWVASRRAPVDIFIATYNEEEAILDRTILAASHQDYEAVRVFVLDDGRREWLKALCERRGVTYVSRPDNAHAKAGNINHALQSVAKSGMAAEFVAILDADFVVQPDFVRKALALFHDPAVGCVQTPQHFFNPDPIQHGFRSANRWPDEQRFFFDVLLASKDAWGAAFSCGTSSICRRRAIEDIGGFPTESVTEDMLLSIKMRTKGWQTVYLNERLSMGLAPEGLPEYVTQRGRWCLGFMQIVRSEWGPFGSAKVPLVDRISLIDAYLYWAGTFTFRIMCIFTPIVYCFTNAKIMNADIESILSYALPTLIAQFTVLPWISRGRCLPILSDASQLLIATAAIKATFIGIFGDRNQKFKVTAKGGDRSRTIIQWTLMKPYVMIAALTLLGIMYHVLNHDTNTTSMDNNYIWVFWAYYNMIVLLIAIVSCIELPRSSEERFRTKEHAVVETPLEAKPVRLCELWPEGARLQTMMPITVGQQLCLSLEDVGPISGRVTDKDRDGLTITFDAKPGLRDRMLLKLFSGRYSTAPDKTTFFDIVSGVTTRVFA